MGEDAPVEKSSTRARLPCFAVSELELREFEEQLSCLLRKSWLRRPERCVGKERQHSSFCVDRTKHSRALLQVE